MEEDLLIDCKRGLLVSAQTSFGSRELHCVAGRPRVLCVGNADAGVVSGEGAETRELGASYRTRRQDLLRVAVV